MKKLCVLFITLFFILFINTCFLLEGKRQEQNIEYIQEKFCTEFRFHREMESEIFYPMLEATAKQFNLNIIRANKRLIFNEQTKQESWEYHKYVLLVNDESELWAKLKLSSGRSLNPDDMQDKNVIVSSEKTNDKNQVGKIKKFIGTKNIFITPLIDSYEHMPFNGSYFVETTNSDIFDKFITVLVEKMNNYYKTQGVKINKSDLMATGNSNRVVFSYFYYQECIIVAIIALLTIIYYIFNCNKKIGIMKLCGISTLKIWWSLIGLCITQIYFCILCLLIVALCFLPCIEFTFALTLILQMSLVALLFIFVSTISCFYISLIKTNEIIKNRKDVKPVLIFNILLKSICVVSIVVALLQMMDNFESISQQNALNKRWDIAKDYGVFYRSLGNDYDLKETNDTNKIFYRQSDELYKYLNKNGALFINASQYEQNYLIANMDYDGIFSVTANVNYLNQFPVYDTNNEKIDVSENDTDYILIVPEKFMTDEKYITDFFSNDRNSEINWDKKMFNHDVSNDIMNQKIKIIWAKNDQWLFSMNSNVFPTENNMIKEPIIRVITEKNSCICARQIDTNSLENIPLKVKLINGNADLTYKKILPKLKSLKLDDNYVDLSSIYETLNNKTKLYVDCIVYDLKQFVIFLLIVLLVVCQIIMLYFDCDKSKIATKKLFGFGITKLYGKYFIMFSLLFVFELLFYTLYIPAYNFLASFLHYVPLAYTNIALLLLLFLYIFQLIFSFIILNIIGRNNVKLINQRS